MAMLQILSSPWPPPLDLGRFRSAVSRMSRGKSALSFSGVMTCSRNMLAEPFEFVLDDLLDGAEDCLVSCKLCASCASSFVAANDGRLLDIRDGREDSCVEDELSFSSQMTS